MNGNMFINSFNCVIKALVFVTNPFTLKVVSVTTLLKKPTYEFTLSHLDFFGFFTISDNSSNTSNAFSLSFNPTIN